MLFDVFHLRDHVLFTVRKTYTPKTQTDVRLDFAVSLQDLGFDM